MRLALICILPLILPPPSAGAEAGDELSVYHMTMGPGDAIFEKFGHNTIRILDRRSGADVVHHWGMFDFNERRFFINFALGRLNYSMASEDYADTVAWYRHLNRSIWLQELNLTASQKLRLRDFCRWNQREENRFYPYNYFTDNCSTRVRDALDHALGGQIKAQLASKPTDTTFRWHTRQLTRDSVPWYTMLNTALGPASDRAISQWEECFLPLRLSGHLKSVTVNGQPLVRSEETIYQSTRPPEPDRPPNWVVQYFVVGSLVGGLIAWLGRAASRRGRAWRIGFGIAAVMYTLAIGFVGWLGLWGWFFTAHWAAWRNENLFEYSPLALPLVVYIPLMLRGKRRAAVVALWLAFGVVASTLIGLLLSPMLPQVMREPMALVMPINLALGFAVWQHARHAKPRAAI